MDSSRSRLIDGWTTLPIACAAILHIGEVSAASWRGSDCTQIQTAINRASDAGSRSGDIAADGVRSMISQSVASTSKQPSARASRDHGSGRQLANGKGARASTKIRRYLSTAARTRLTGRGPIGAIATFGIDGL